MLYLLGRARGVLLASFFPDQCWRSRLNRAGYSTREEVAYEGMHCQSCVQGARGCVAVYTTPKIPPVDATPQSSKINFKILRFINLVRFLNPVPDSIPLVYIL